MVLNMNSIIKFINNMPHLTENSVSCPESSIKNLPEWYKNADKFYINNFNENREILNSNTKTPTWKACPGIFDSMTMGYVLKTPCDITFYLDADNEINVKVENPIYRGFCLKRNSLHQFVPPFGYHDYHFAWTADWGIETEKGYSCLYLNPINHFQLPFLNTVGVIDTDQIGSPGSLPFFLIKNWTGTIPAGTPYAQIIPFKREDWQMEIKLESKTEINSRMHKMLKTFRVPGGGVYKNKFWQKKKYL